MESLTMPPIAAGNSHGSMAALRIRCEDVPVNVWRSDYSAAAFAGLSPMSRAARYFSASSAAMQPMPAAVTACR